MSTRTLDKLLAGEIPSFKVGPMRRIPLADLERYVDRLRLASVASGENREIR